jgi:hypothetical protein
MDPKLEPLERNVTGTADHLRPVTGSAVDRMLGGILRPGPAAIEQ